MKLSIITVNLNNREGLQKTIDSVVSQTFKDFEWIVIDGGSTDGSKELIEQYADHFAYWVSEPDKGIYNAMNKGIRVAKGEYLQFLNSGDWFWEKTSLEKAFSFQPTAEIVYADIKYVENDEAIETRRFLDAFGLSEYLGNGLCHNSTFFRKEVMIDNPYNEEFRIASDVELFLKTILQNRSYEHIPIILIGFDTKGISFTNLQLSEKESITIKKKLISPIIQKDINSIRYLSSLPSNKVLKEIDYFRGKYKLYHKAITASLMLMRFINRIFHKTK